MPPILDSRKPLRGNIADYVTEQLPYVPSLIIACVKEIESRSRERMTLYRHHGDLTIARGFLKNYLHSKKVPNLRSVDVQTIGSILKLFLASLSEPLITDKLRDKFVDAALIANETERDAALSKALIFLPYPNLHTLSYLIHHLRFISKLSRTNNYARLAVVFGPIVVGGSSRYLTPHLFIIEREDQDQVIESLLEIDDYYNDFLPYSSQNS
ncbi:rac GTPase-activating protein 1-like [Venturia canescens]|uniref:rac GTPase-activating protein 1-like n=1 Tax=Venturia canescens TaxID=32260 RepID=UPI001C9BDEE9|nr:rac GTPase-activating protein 1-like [Venturia canescens]